MRVYIEYGFVDSAHGGGNQFLKALRNELVRMGLYTNEPRLADVILFNSHHNGNNVSQLRKMYPRKKFVHRVDGPMRLYNTMEDKRDSVVYKMNGLSNATIFQSNWSYDQNKRMGMKIKGKHAVIPNACDQSIFNNIGRSKGVGHRIIIASHSSNINKGFKYYQHLDNNIADIRAECVFAGNSPVPFKKIKNLGLLDSRSLANELRKSTIFLTASKNDPCSNSVIEAMHCGLPVVALNSGGHPELVSDDKLLFNNEEEMMNVLIGLKNDYSFEIKFKDITEVAKSYISFFCKI